MPDTKPNPEMIRLARTSRGLHQSQVAEHLGIKQPTYSKIESGHVQPSAEQLELLSQVLNYPVAFFLQTDRIWGTASPHHRKRKSLSQATLQQLEAQLNVIRLNVRRLMVSVAIEPLFELPALDLDVVGTPAEAARQARRLWRVPTGPIEDMARLIEDAGVIIFEQPSPNDRLDAVSVWGPGEWPIIMCNASYSTDRRRFTLAHELGHLVMHASDVTDDPEREANEFASEFLMPEEIIRAELRGLRLQALPDLKRRWRVSMRALVTRAQSLGELTKDQARYMFVKLNQQYGAKREPVDLPDESHGLLSEILSSYLNDLEYSVGQVADVALAFEDDFADRYGLHPRHLRAV